MKTSGEKKKTTIDRIAPLIGVLLVFTVWFAVSGLELVSPYVLPTPQKVFGTFLKMLQSDPLTSPDSYSGSKILKGNN